jgi:uncharacterized membrane protein
MAPLGPVDHDHSTAALAMRYRLHTLLIVLALGPVVLAVSWWALTGGKEEQAVIGAVVFTVIAVWFGSRAVIYLNTRM